MATTSARDGCVVDTEPLAAMLRGFVSSWHRTRPPTGGRRASPNALAAVAPVGAYEWLENETRLHGRHVPKRTIEHVMRGRSRTTDLSIADALVASIGQPQALADGTLEVRARRSDGGGCCGVSRVASPAWSLDDGSPWSPDGDGRDLLGA